MAGYNWFDAATKGRNYGQAQDDRKLALLNNAEDRRRRITAENLAIQNDAEDRKETLFQIARLNKIRKAQENRNPTLINDFQYAGGNGYTGGAPSGDSTFAPVQVRYGTDASGNVDKNTVTYPGGSGQITGQATGQLPTATGQAPVIPGQVPVDTSVIPTFDTTPAADLERGRADAIKQGGEEYNTAIAGENKRFADVTSAKEMQQKHLASLQEKSYQRFLPTFEGVASEKSLNYARSGFEQDMVDTPQVQKAQSFVSGVESFLEQGKGSASGTGSNWANIALNYFGLTAGSSADQKKVLQENRDMEDFFNTNVIGSSDAEKWFAMYPDEMEEVFGGATDSKTQRENLFAYYQETIKPALASKGADKQVHTKEAIAQAKADYASLITNTDNAIETLKQMTEDASQPMKDEFAKYEADIAAAEKARAAGNLKREQELLEKVKKNPVHNMLNAEAYGQDVKQKITARERLVEQFNYASKTLKDMDKVNEIQTKIVQADIDLWSGVAYQGVANLKNGKGVAVIESVLGEYEGATIRVVSRSDGTYMVAGNGQFMEPGKGKGNVWTKGELEDYVLGKASATYKAKMMERSDMMFKAKVKGQVTAQDRYNKVAELNKIIAEVTLQNKGKMDIEAFKKLSGVTDVKPLGDGTATFTHGGNLFSYNPFPGTSEINGVEMPNKKGTEIYRGTAIYKDATGTK